MAGSRRSDLREGLYEQVVTAQLARAIADSAATTMVASLEDADLPAVLARHLAREIERALETMPREERAQHGRALVDEVLDHLARGAGADAAEQIREQRVEPPPRRLLAVHRGAAPERPATPLATSTLLTRNRLEPPLGRELGREIATANQIDAIVAFVTVGGVRAIEEALRRFSHQEGARLRLVTTTFTGTTEARALDLLARLPGAQVKVSYDTRRTRLHAKAWLFHRATGLSTAYVGSANLTSTALGVGQEWMMKVCAADLPHVIDKFAGTFETLWEDGELEDYQPDNVEHRARLRAALARAAGGELERDRPSELLVALRPLPFQAEILDRLAAERAVHGRRRNLVVAATGTGKTVIAALDYARQSAARGTPPRLLFLAHRRELLEQARRTFQHAMQDAAFGELLVGGEAPARGDHVFASIQSAGAMIAQLGAGHFRHVVIDECHHVPARSYQAVLAQLSPEILVGLTATPERSDGRSLLPDFDGHVAAELRLWQALDTELLVPFEYYGISDGVDLRRVRWSPRGYDVDALDGVYTGNDARADLIRHQLERRVSDVRKVRALGFCVSVEHATYMAARFTAAGVPALAVHGGSPPALREEAPRRLREGEVSAVFTCDLYNEGVDLPFVDTLLLLRPTASATLFLQQLGRGLRHFRGKSSCLVLDFIGQHRSEFRFDAIYSALTGTPRGRLRRAVEEEFPYLPSGCVLQLDAVAREQVLRGLQATLGGAARLTEELRALAAGGGRPTLAAFLAETGRELDDVYTAGGWTTLLRRAGIEPPGRDDEGDGELSRRLGWLTHVDEPARLRTYRDAIAAALADDARALTARERTQVHMLGYQLAPRGTLATAEETLASFASRPSIARELEELRGVLEDQVALADQVYPVTAWPLALHRHYTRREIVAAVGFVAPGAKGKLPQGGILQLAEARRELLFVTLDKSGKAFSPTTRYRDYAISAERFHWETQAAASQARPSGRRYVESPGNGWTFFLFVRTDPDAAYAFLGPVRYVGHTGDRPLAITWQLETPMPAVLFERYATLRG